MTARESLTAALAHASALAQAGQPSAREFWRRLAGSLRKALTMLE